MAGGDKVIAAFEAEHRRRVQNLTDMGDWWAAFLTNHMRQNIRWTDRTGAAKQSLEAFTEWEDDITFWLILKGGGPPPYVKYLELGHGGPYIVRAKRKKALHWVDKATGEDRFAKWVTIPAWPGLPIIRPTFEQFSGQIEADMRRVWQGGEKA